MAEENRFLQTSRPLGRPPEPKPLFYILSFFLPAGGLVLAAIFMGRAEEDHRRFGERCLIAVLILIGFDILLLFCYIVVLVYVLPTRHI